MRELPKTDQQMLARLADRSESAWLDFVEIYEVALVRFCISRGLSREDSADVCQEVFAALDDCLVNKRFDSSKGGFRNWLFRVARNISVDTFCKRAKQINAGGGTSVRQLIESTPDNNDFSRAIEFEYRRSLAGIAAARIKPLVNETTWLCFWETAINGRTPDEIAVKLGVSVGVVYTAKCRMIAKVRKVVALHDDQSHDNEMDDFQFLNEVQGRDV